MSYCDNPGGIYLFKVNNRNTRTRKEKLFFSKKRMLLRMLIYAEIFHAKSVNDTVSHFGKVSFRLRK